MADTLYIVVYPSALAAPSNTQIAAGQDVNGAAAVYASSLTTGVTNTYSFNVTGLAAGTSYKASLWHDDANAADIETTGAFVTTGVAISAVEAAAYSASSITRYFFEANRGEWGGGIAEWAVGTAYAVGDQVTYQGATYECLQAHTAIVGWYPNVVPALWATV